MPDNKKGGLVIAVIAALIVIAWLIVRWYKDTEGTRINYVDKRQDGLYIINYFDQSAKAVLISDGIVSYQDVGVKIGSLKNNGAITIKQADILTASLDNLVAGSKCNYFYRQDGNIWVNYFSQLHKYEIQGQLSQTNDKSEILGVLDYYHGQGWITATQYKILAMSLQGV